MSRVDDRLRRQIEEYAGDSSGTEAVEDVLAAIDLAYGDGKDKPKPKAKSKPTPAAKSPAKAGAKRSAKPAATAPKPAKPTAGSSTAAPAAVATPAPGRAPGLDFGHPPATDPTTDGFGGATPPPDRFGDAVGGADGDGAMPRTVTPPTAPPAKSRTPWLVLGMLALAIAAVLVYLTLRPSDQTSVDAIVEGQCFANFDQFEASEIRSSVSGADCADAHALEVFEVTNAPYTEFDEYPGEQVITDLAFRHCLEGFEEFVGTTYEESTLDVWALYPTEGSWNLNSDREVVCMVGAFDQSLTTGTLRGSGQ